MKARVPTLLAVCALLLLAHVRAESTPETTTPATTSAATTPADTHPPTSDPVTTTPTTATPEATTPLTTTAGCQKDSCGDDEFCLSCLHLSECTPLISVGGTCGGGLIPCDGYQCAGNLTCSSYAWAPFEQPIGDAPNICCPTLSCEPCAAGYYRGVDSNHCQTCECYPEQCAGALMLPATFCSPSDSMSCDAGFQCESSIDPLLPSGGVCCEKPVEEYCETTGCEDGFFCRQCTDPVTGELAHGTCEKSVQEGSFCSSSASSCPDSKCASGLDCVLRSTPPFQIAIPLTLKICCPVMNCTACKKGEYNQIGSNGCQTCECLPLPCDGSFLKGSYCFPGDYTTCQNLDPEYACASVSAAGSIMNLCCPARYAPTTTTLITTTTTTCDATPSLCGSQEFCLQCLDQPSQCSSLVGLHGVCGGFGACSGYVCESSLTCVTQLQTPYQIERSDLSMLCCPMVACDPCPVGHFRKPDAHGCPTCGCAPMPCGQLEFSPLRSTACQNGECGNSFYCDLDPTSATNEGVCCPATTVTTPAPTEPTLEVSTPEETSTTEPITYADTCVDLGCPSGMFCQRTADPHGILQFGKCYHNSATGSTSNENSTPVNSSPAVSTTSSSSPSSSPMSSQPPITSTSRPTTTRMTTTTTTTTTTRLCRSSSECRDTHYCEICSSANAGHCKPRLSTGQVCGGFSLCTGSLCTSGLECTEQLYSLFKPAPSEATFICCPVLSCDTACSAGFTSGFDVNGCKTCACVPKPCEAANVDFMQCHPRASNCPLVQPRCVENPAELTEGVCCPALRTETTKPASTTPDPASGNEESSSSSSKTPAIAAGLTAGLVALVILIGIVAMIIIRRRQRQRTISFSNLESPFYQPSPFRDEHEPAAANTSRTRNSRVLVLDPVD
eukprot:m.51348 g.51348  ORF g.51348 m.51348 type:complete len:898 (+) comp48287_c0_seq1:25-2718(+)